VVGFVREDGQWLFGELVLLAPTRYEPNSSEINVITYWIAASLVDNRSKERGAITLAQECRCNVNRLDCEW
jgi:hypothetical protein